MPKKTPAIGTPAFHDECNKVLQTMVEVLADRFAGGNQKELAKYLTIGLLTRCGEEEIVGDSIEGTAAMFGAALFGNSNLGVTLAGQIVQRIAEAKSEATGKAAASCVMEIIGEVMSKATAQTIDGGTKRGDPKSIQEALKQLLKDED